MKSKKIKNYSNYAISRSGEVTKYLKDGSSKIVNTTRKVHGGYTVAISNKQGKYFDLATLVANTYLGVANGKELGYKDHNLDNCNADNLYYTDKVDYYCTSSIMNEGKKAIRLTKYKWVTEDGEILTKRYDNYDVNKPKVKHGYPYIKLGENSANLHKIVATLFIPNPNNYPVVAHIDENKNNNAASNLRWCTYQQNSEYYNTDNGKDMMKVYAKQMKVKKEAELLKTKRLQEDVRKLRKELHKSKVALKKEHEAFEKYKHRELLSIERSKKSYNGYADTTATTFGCIDKMVEATGKAITVDGVEFISAGAAASYIVDEETNVGNSRKKATISKELRRYLQGKRPQWIMYDKYTVGY